MPLRTTRLASVLLVTAAPPARLSAQTPPVVVNTGTVVVPAFFTPVPSVAVGPSAAFLRVPEAGQGVDLNGDGDLLDSVAHVVLLRTGAVRNLGHAIASTFAQVGARAVAFVVDEAADGGVDHDGDGSAQGRVLFVHDLVTGATTSTGIAFPVPVVVGSRYLATIASEAALGLGDANGDGAIAQTVVLRDFATGSTQYGGPSPQQIHAGAGRILWRAHESTLVGDLNGDGDLSDEYLTALDESSGAILTLPFRESGTQPFVAAEDFVAFRVDESDMGPRDLNGDGDTTDRLSALILRGVARPRFVDIVYEAAIGADGVVAFVVRENQTGVDRNGDGDLLDSQLSVYDARRRTLSHLPIAVRYDSAFGIQATIARGVVAFGVPEQSQGQVDLDGDGDALDVVVHAYAVSTGTTLSSGLAISGTGAGGEWAQIRASAGRVGFLVSESDQGIDLNGNGFPSDLVAHVWSPFAPTPSIQDLGQCVRLGFKNSFSLEGDRFAMCAREEATDSNGDGDRLDTVVRVVDLAHGTVTETGLVVLDPAGPPPFLAADGFVVLAAKEGESVGGDYNGDFDVADHAVIVLRLRD